MSARASSSAASPAPNPVTVHLMRHGAPIRPGLLLGRTDDPATPAGIAACVDGAAGLAVTSIVASDLIRASACAAAIAAARTLPVHTDPRWREMDFGDWDGSAPAAIDPLALGRLWQDPDGCPPPNGERWSGLVMRVADALAAVENATLVVTHGGGIRAALAGACGLDAQQVWAFDLPYAAVLSLRLWRGETPAAQIVGLHT